MESPRIENDCMYVTDSTRIEEVLGRIQEAEITEIYMDACSFSGETIINRAQEFHTHIARKTSLYEPVVICPLRTEESDLREALAKLCIRTTTKSFEDYCTDIRKNREHNEKSQLSPFT